MRPAGYNQEAIRRPSRGNQEAIKRQSRGNQEAIKSHQDIHSIRLVISNHQEAIRRPSGGRQEAINDAPRSCALRAGQRATRRIGRRRRRALGPARRSESRLMRRAISMHSEGISREASSVAISMQSACIQRGSQGRHHPWQSACNQHALRGDLKGGIIRMQSACNQHAIRGDLKGGIIRGNPHAISMQSVGISREASTYPWQSACNQRRSESGRCGFRRRSRHPSLEAIIHNQRSSPPWIKM